MLEITPARAKVIIMGITKDGGNIKSYSAYDEFWLGKTPDHHRVTFNQVCDLITWRARVESKQKLNQDEKLNLGRLLDTKKTKLY